MNKKQKKEAQIRVADLLCRGGHSWKYVKNPKIKESIFVDGPEPATSELIYIKECIKCRIQD